MAENTKLILKPKIDEIFTPQNYKIHPTLIENPLWPSLDKQSSLNDKINNIITPSATLQTRLDINKVIGIHYEGETKSVSELNNQAEYGTINSLRNESISYTNIRSTEDATMEYIPEHPHILEQIENIERMKTEYSSKLNMLNYLVDNLFDTGYATNMYMLGRDTRIFLSGDKLLLNSLGDEVRISGYIKAENCNEGTTLNMIIRGIPVPMRRTLTSKNYNSTGNIIRSYNYIFTYPQYLMDNIDIIQSIQYIEVNNVNASTTFWYGQDYNFSDNDVLNFSGYENSIANIHIVNKDTRNLDTNEIETQIKN